MFWNKSKKQNGTNSGKTKGRKEPQDSCVGKKNAGQSSVEKRFKGDTLRTQALANARAARENLGEDTIQKISEIMKKMENSQIAKAQKQIAAADPDRVLDELKWMLDNRDA